MNSLGYTSPEFFGDDVNKLFVLSTRNFKIQKQVEKYFFPRSISILTFSFYLFSDNRVE